MKKQLALLILCSPLIVMAQNSLSKKSQEINWVVDLSMEQIKQKAKEENKYIFIDAFTTWCGPCKLMDENVYVNDTISSYFNKNFISVKVQMDKTTKDGELIKNWYSAAAALAKEYRIEAYPSLIFLSPEGKIVHKALGYQGVNKLIEIAKIATKPGKVYEDAYAEYDNLVKEYKGGVKHYNKMPYMVTTAFKFGDNDLGKELLKEYTEYAKKISKDQRYTKENILFWSGFLLKSDGDLFQFFYKDERIIDKMMNQKGYAKAIVDKTVQHEVTDSFYKMQHGETTLITGEKLKSSEVMALGKQPVRLDGKINANNVEADWRKLYEMIRQKFDKKTAKRNVLLARIKWYDKHSNYTAWANSTLQLYKKDPPNLTPLNAVNIMNDLGWNVFCYVPASERRIINSTIKWVKKGVDLAPTYTPMLDTYANLLYKMGKKEEAILWEEKAVNVAKAENAARIEKGQAPLTWGWSPETFQATVEKMKKGEKTALDQGALWN